MTSILLKGHLHNRRWVGLVMFLTLSLLLSACTAPAPQPTNLPPAASPTRPIADSLTRPPAIRNPQSEIRNLQQAAYNYNRYHALAPDDLLGLKRLTEVCTALERAGVEDESCRETALPVAEEQGEIRNSQFAICTRRWKPAPTTGASWRNCWVCRWRAWNRG